MKIKTNKIISVLIMMSALGLIGFAMYNSVTLLTHFSIHGTQELSNNHVHINWIYWLYPFSALFLGVSLYIGSQFIWFSENKSVSA